MTPAQALAASPLAVALRCSSALHAAVAGGHLGGVALLVGTYERDRIEARLGMAVKIMYVAETTRPLARDSEVHYRKSYLLAAQAVAQSMSAQQWIAPMTPDELHQPEGDVVVHIGKDYR